MTKLQVELSDSIYQFVADQAVAQGFASPSEYLAALASEAEANREAIDQELMKGLESGPPREMQREDWDELRRRVGERKRSENRA